MKKISDADREFLIAEYQKLGRDKFQRLYYMLNNCCIDELGIADCENCKRTPIDSPDEFCIECIVNELDKLM